jgi:hypothetical protein
MISPAHRDRKELVVKVMTSSWELPVVVLLANRQKAKRMPMRKNGPSVVISVFSHKLEEQ